MIRKFFGDGDRDFALPAKMILELERKRSIAFGALLNRVRAGQFYFDDVAETIRLALIGGGAPPHEAHALVTAYVGTEGNPLIEAQILATEILLDHYAGKPAEQVSNEPA